MLGLWPHIPEDSRVTSSHAKTANVGCHSDHPTRDPGAVASCRFRRYWRWKSQSGGGRPQIDADLRVLIRRMSVDNPFAPLLIPAHIEPVSAKALTRECRDLDLVVSQGFLISSRCVL
jgi:hypothetical protein